jgi:hypothetical protein
MSNWTLREWAGNFDIAVTVANGGYVVHAVPIDEECALSFSTCVFTDVDVALGYMRRVMLSKEGPLNKDDLFNEQGLTSRHGPSDDGTAGSATE